MAIVPVFHGRVTEEGRLVLQESERAQRQNYLHYLAGRLVDVVIRKKRTQRSLDQNAYLHAVPFPMLADHFGNTIEEMKYALMGECWGWKLDKATGREVPVKAHTSRMTVEECVRFIEWLIPWAMVHHGVQIPLPGEAEAA